MSSLSDKDRKLIVLYATAGLYKWDELEECGREAYDAGACEAEVVGCVRHLVVFAGYGPCLAAMTKLRQKKVIKTLTPGKIGGRPGNAFSLVYDGIQDAVKNKVHDTDPVLGQWIQCHLYGDVYSSPGLSMRQKQLMTLSGLAKANMQQQMYGHAIAGIRFGLSREDMKEAIDVTLGLTGTVDVSIQEEQHHMIDLAYAKCKREGYDCRGDDVPVDIPDSWSVWLPLHPNEECGRKPSMEESSPRGGRQDYRQVHTNETNVDSSPTFVWEELQK